MPESSEDARNVSTTEGPTFLDTDELSTSIPTYYTTKQAAEAMREGLKQARAKWAQDEDLKPKSPS